MSDAGGGKATRQSPDHTGVNPAGPILLGANEKDEGMTKGGGLFAIRNPNHMSRRRDGERG